MKEASFLFGLEKKGENSKVVLEYTSLEFEKFLVQLFNTGSFGEEGSLVGSFNFFLLPFTIM
jgi:hypothetical protein